MTALERQSQIAYVAHLFAVAFHASRGISDLPDQTYRATAVTSGARIVKSDRVGGDLDSVREIASATLIGQDFRVEAVNLWLDDLTHDSATLAGEQRRAAGQ